MEWTEMVRLGKTYISKNMYQTHWRLHDRESDKTLKKFDFAQPTSIDDAWDAIDKQAQEEAGAEWVSINFRTFSRITTRTVAMRENCRCVYEPFTNRPKLSLVRGWVYVHGATSIDEGIRIGREFFAELEKEAEA